MSRKQGRLSSQGPEVVSAHGPDWNADWVERAAHGSPYHHAPAQPDEEAMDHEEGNAADLRQEGRREALDFFLRWAFKAGHDAKRIGLRVQRLALDLGRKDLLPIKNAKELGDYNGERKQTVSKRGREMRELFGGKTPMQRSDDAIESSRKAAKRAWKRTQDLRDGDGSPG
jgi:hypothetical protein